MTTLLISVDQTTVELQRHYDQLEVHGISSCTSPMLTV